MGLQIQDRMEISLFFSGIEFPLAGLNTLNSLQIDMSIKVILPTIQLVITDELEMLTQTGVVQDATPISVVIKAFGQATATTYNFRLFKYKSFKATVGTMYIIDGYWDSQKYWLASTTTGIRGTSNDVLTQVAAACGLKYKGTSTGDSQLWMPQNRSYGNFVKKIVAHGYASGTSLMVAGVDLTGTLLYQDFNVAPDAASVINVSLGQYVPGALPAVDYNPKNYSGFNNRMTGYNNVRVSQSMYGAEQTSIKDLQFTSDSRSPFYSVATKNTAAQGSVLFSGIDAGNTHSSYEQAFYQNQRYKNLLNAGIDVMTTIPTTLNLLDAFNFVDQNDDGTSANQSWSGVYRLTSKAIHIEGASYSELFEGYRHGTNLPVGS